MNDFPAAEDRRLPRFLHRLGEVVVAFVAGYVAGAVVLTVVPLLVFGWSPTVVSSGSMSPVIRSGDMVLVDPEGGIGPGAVAQFHDGSGRLTLHRVVAIDGEGTLTTRGDANGAVDSTPVDPSRIVGRAVLLIPNLFHPLSVAMVVLAAAVALVRTVRSFRRLRSVGGGVGAVALVFVVGAGLTMSASRAAFADTTESGGSTLDALVVEPPANLTATCAGSALNPNVNLSWSGSPTSGVTHYEVLHGVNSPPAAPPLVTVPASQTTYVHNIPVSLLAIHNYAVRARLGPWVSEPSNVDGVRITSLFIGVLCTAT